MNLKQHIELASKTCPKLENMSLDILHMNMGIYTELGEIVDIIKKHIAYGKTLDIVHIGEEIGDCQWYNSNKARLQGKEDLRPTQRFAFISLQSMANTLIEIDVKFESYSMITNILIGLCEYFGLNFEEVLDKNIAKLKARFPDGFTQDKALNRDLETERKTLE